MVGNVRYELEHVTKYRYGIPVRNCAMSLALKPTEDRRQRVSGFRIETEPDGSLFQVEDSFGNTRHQFHLYREHRSLVITARSTVDVAPCDSSPELLENDAWATIRDWRNSFHHRVYLDHSAMARPSSTLERFIRENGIQPTDDPLNALERLSATLYDRFHYDPGTTTFSSTIEHILDSGSGVCQDYAHVMIAIARTWGIPARYVSGYLHDVAAEGSGDGTTTTHAWVECLLPGLCWIAFDPTNATRVDERHVRVAVGRDYRDVSPTHGVLQGGGEIEIEVAVTMRPLSGIHPGTAQSGRKERSNE